MSKIEILNDVTEKLGDFAEQIGLVAMTAATVLSVAQPSDHSRRTVLPKTVTFAPVWETTQENNPIRREKEEAPTVFVSYREAQRTPGRSRIVA